MKELKRVRYLEMIRPFYNDGGMIKVLIGLRRCGKSTIMKQISEEIREQTPDANIIYLDLDEDVYRNVSTPDQLDAEIKKNIAPGSNFLFIDEVQNVDGFEKVVESYRKKNISTFLTGSNSYLLSGELTTKLTGRYFEFRILPFSFSEVEEYRRTNNIDVDPQKDFNDYLIYGGLPKRFDYPDASSQQKYVFSVIEETKKKDILKRSKVRDMALLDRMIAFVASIPSQEISSNSIKKYIAKEGIRTKQTTVSNYLDKIFSSNIASKCQRYDVVGKKALKTLYKSYLSDLAIHTFISGKKDRLDFGMLIENIVYNELISRGYTVLVGKKGKYEIDFVISDGLKKAYIQVAYLIPEQEVLDREERPLLSLKDNYPKYIVSMDPITMSDNGIIRLNLIDDFLLGDRFSL